MLPVHQRGRGIVAAQYLFWVTNHWHGEGGCKEYRTQAMEMDCIMRLRQAYSGLVRVGLKTSSEWSIEIAA